jgi:putative Mg2+ transporter-C (MgtC) family protein
MNSLLWHMVLRLLLAGALGALIGYEREAHGRPAGLRTHILVCLGSALFTIVSGTYGGEHSDPGRIASQIVSGIGFLGAGTIIRQGSVVRGLTTAASLWTTAAIGMAAGAGGATLIYLAVFASIIVFVTLGVINTIERSMISRRETRDLVVTLPGGRAGVRGVLGAVVKLGATIQGVRTEETEEGLVQVRLRLMLPAGLDVGRINAELAQVQSVGSFDWE